MPKEAAIEIMILNPDPAVHYNKKGVHENLWIKQRYGKDNYLSIGVHLKAGHTPPELQYYFFEECDQFPHLQIFSSLEELQQHLPAEKHDLFERTHKVYLMGHGDAESKYGFGNYHAHDDFSHLPDYTEQIYDDSFDKLIQDILKNIHAQKGEIGITLEECHADNLVTAKLVTTKEMGKPKSFLERLSENYPHITFSGTGPWSDSEDLQKSLAIGSRASGGYPNLNVPITSMGGSVWKHGNTVIFYHGDDQIAARKSMFASTETAKELKVNTVQYAREILKETLLDDDEKEKLIKRICLDRNVLKIEDLKKIPGFPENKFEGEEIAALETREKQILEKEKNNYITRVQDILARTESGEKPTERDALILALGLKGRFVFDGHEDLLDGILNNKVLLPLIMVSCGKVLIAGPSNDNVIDLLLEHDVDINSVDEKGMTALHYAVQNFYDYREEPLNLIKKLLDSGANIEAKDRQGRTPLMLAIEHAKEGTVFAGEKLIELLQARLAATKESPERGNSTACMLGSLGVTQVPVSRIEPHSSSSSALDPPRAEHLQLLISQIKASEASEQNFWKYLEISGGTPVIEDIPHDEENKKVTFYWEGPEPASDDLSIYLVLESNVSNVADFTNPTHLTEADRLTRIPGTNIYSLSLTLPNDLLSTYSFRIKKEGSDLLDRNNPQCFDHPDPNRKYCTSILRMPNAPENKYQSDKKKEVAESEEPRRELKNESIDLLSMGYSIFPAIDKLDIIYSENEKEFLDNMSKWRDEHQGTNAVLLINNKTSGEWGVIRPTFGVPIKGELLDVLIKNPPSPTEANSELEREVYKFMHQITCQVYLPKGHQESDESCPLVLQLDGNAYQELITPAILDEMIAQGKIPPTVVVFLSPLKNRMEEYACDDHFTEFLAEKFVPELRERFHCSQEARDTFITGSSMSGLASVYAGLKHPEVFGNVISQSGALWCKQEKINDALAKFSAEEGEVSFTMDAGRFESGLFEEGKISLLEANRAMAEKMSECGQYRYREFSGGHCFLCWQTTWPDRIISAFENVPAQRMTDDAAGKPGFQ